MTIESHDVSHVDHKRSPQDAPRAVGELERARPAAAGI